MVMLNEVGDPERFGVPVFENRKITRTEEKPSSPKSNFTVMGVYIYDWTVFNRVRTLTPSGRGEFEITDVNSSYIAEGALSHEVLDGWWTDAGTFESLWRASNLLHAKVIKSVEDNGVSQ